MHTDTIQPHTVEEAHYLSIKSWAVLFQNCVKSDVFVKSRRKATFDPIFEKLNLHQPSRYTPINLTTIPSKVIECTLKPPVCVHQRDNNLLSSHQHGLLPGRSCAKSKPCIMDSLTHESDDGKVSRASLFGLAIAFDRVPHIPIPYKLESDSFSGQLYFLFVVFFLINSSLSKLILHTPITLQS